MLLYIEWLVFMFCAPELYGSAECGADLRWLGIMVLFGESGRGGCC